MALEPIKCTTFSREIEQEYLKVVRGIDQDTTWLIISPDDKKEYKPEYVGSDFGEFLSTFEDAKVQFGLARVSPPGSDVKKLILIGWCPDSAPLKTKASFAANFGTVANQLLNGYHIQVTARDEDDLDKADLLQKISNAAGARYSIQTNAQERGQATSPSPSLTKTMPKQVSQPKLEVDSRADLAAISTPVSVVKKQSTRMPFKKPVSSDGDDGDDWDEPEVEERDFDQNPLKPNASSYKPLGKINLQSVIDEEKGREDPRLVNAIDPSRKIAPGDDIAQLKEQSRLKRDQEMNKFLGTKPPSAPQKNVDLTIKGFSNEKSPAQLWAEKKRAAASASGAAPTSSVENSKQSSDPKAEVGSADENEETDVSDLKSKFEKLSSSAEPPIISPKSVESKPVSFKAESPTTVSVDPSKFGRPLPGMNVEISNREDADAGEEENDDWDEEDASSAPSIPSTVTRKHPEDEKKAIYESGQEQAVEEEPAEEELVEEEPAEEELVEEEPAEEELVEEEPAPSLPSRKSVAPPPPTRRSVEPPKEALPSAIAEYDYEAGEDNELTFKENDRIIDIDFVDDDWWLGELEESGEKGLFPSNYVSLQN